MDFPTRKVTFHEITHLRLLQKPSLKPRVWMWLAGLNPDHPDSPHALLEIDLTVVPVVDLTDEADEEGGTDMDMEMEMEMVESGSGSGYYYYYCSDERVEVVTISSADRREVVTISEDERGEVITIPSDSGDDSSSCLDDRVAAGSPDVITISSDSADDSTNALDAMGGERAGTPSSSATPPSKAYRANTRASSPLAIKPSSPLNVYSYLGPGLKVCLLVLEKMMRRYRLAGASRRKIWRVLRALGEWIRARVLGVGGWVSARMMGMGMRGGRVRRAGLRRLIKRRGGGGEVVVRSVRKSEAGTWRSSGWCWMSWGLGLSRVSRGSWRFKTEPKDKNS